MGKNIREKKEETYGKSGEKAQSGKKLNEWELGTSVIEGEPGVKRRDCRKKN